MPLPTSHSIPRELLRTLLKEPILTGAIQKIYRLSYNPALMFLLNLHCFAHCFPVVPHLLA